MSGSTQLFLPQSSSAFSLNRKSNTGTRIACRCDSKFKEEMASLNVVLLAVFIMILLEKSIFNSYAINYNCLSLIV